MKITKKKQIAALAAIPLVALSTSAQAATALIDFSDANGTTSGNWNNIGVIGTSAPLTIDNMIDDAGVTGTIDLALTFGAGIGYGGAYNTGDTGAPAPFDTATAYGDGMYTNVGVPITLAFTGLAASTNYEFSLYGGRNPGSPVWNNATIAVTEGTSNGGDFLAEDRSVTTFSIISTASGTATFTFDELNTAGNSNDNATINAMSITAVPEPSSAALLGLGGLSLILRRRK